MKISQQNQSRLLTLLLFLPIAPLCAQVGNDNITGPAGIFNGNVTTAGSYDPYTGNAVRSVTDIVVAGAVGKYPLAFTRSANSRAPLLNVSGNWKHSYQWSIGSAYFVTPNGQPTTYDIQFPDGRYLTFQTSAGDTLFRGPAGTRERFQQLNLTTMLAYLILADGGKVEFKATKIDMGYYYYYAYAAQAVIDPYGQRTSLTYDINGNLVKITEPAGRSITITYGNFNGLTVITDVTGSDGRTVHYNYAQAAFPPGTTSWIYLSSVSYYGDASIGSAVYTYRAPNVPDSNGRYNGMPLLATCDDPMYAGPMKRIAYVYQTTNNPDGSAPVYGQILSENYYNGTSAGAALTTLAVTGSSTRKETRADGKWRTFTYTNALLTSLTDFKNVAASQTYDTKSYINSVTDRNAYTTNFTRNALNGFLTQIQYPITTSDTPGQTVRPTVNYTYGNSGCTDANNRDANNPYYVCTATDEGGHVTQFYRDTNHRVTQINYPDGGYETFAYNSFGEVTSHRMTTSGTETFTYDARGVKTTYSDPYHNSSNPSIRYYYDTLDRLDGVFDVLGHPTNWDHNSRGQVTVTTLATDPVDGVRHTITNVYNSDGTLRSTTDELGHVTSYTYDDYRRKRSVATPARYAGDPTNHTTTYFYDATGTIDYYGYSDSNVSYVTLPSGKRINTTYDENRRKSSVTVAVGTSDAATTSYGYDKVGNITSVVAPNEQSGQQYAGESTVTAYDQRNRPSQVSDALGNTTKFTYDTAGRKKSVTRPNTQSITYDSYDAMNRLLQQTATQTPEPNAVTKYTYTQAGLLATMQDPRLVALGSTYKYTYAYDTMGRKTSVTYPPASSGSGTTESFTYDTAGRLSTSTNRNGKMQTLTYDALNRMTGFSWNDGITPSLTFGYDAGLRLTSVTNANATISRVYWNDNLLRIETETPTGGLAGQMVYTYDADGNRATVQYPGPHVFTYTYTGRNQLNTLVDGSTTLATYGYAVNGNLTSRSLGNSTSSSYMYDELDRVAQITHALNGETRTFDYAYDSVGNREWTKRDGGTGDVFGYDYNDQVTAVKLDIPNPEKTLPGLQTIVYDANGNRTSFSPYGTTDTYTLNNLNEYTARNSTTATYDLTGNMTSGVDGSSYAYDAQNRLTSASKSGTTETFKYDGLNRQVSRTVSGTTTYNVYDGWDLIEEYQSSGALTAQYLYGAGGLVKNLVSGNYYYQDGSGSTSHLADSAGRLLEWYRYDLQGTPVFYNFLNTQQPASAYGIRHLFTGQQWYSELGLYDLRNRFYSPDIGRFLQTDPIGFNGDASNLYRYCGNNPLKRSDPSGQIMWQIWGYEDRVIVDGSGFFGNNSTHGELNLSYSDAMLELGVIGSIGGREPLGLYERPDISGGHELPSSPQQPGQPNTPPPLPPSPPAFNPTVPFTLDAPPLDVPQVPDFQQYTLNIGLPFLRGLFGLSVSVSKDIYGQTYFSFGPQIGKSVPYFASVSATGNWVSTGSPAGPNQIAQALQGLSWNAGGGSVVGLQWSWAFNRWPWQPSTAGVGLMSSQGGMGLNYTW